MAKSKKAMQRTPLLEILTFKINYNMQLKQILSIEENRTEDSTAVIHLFQEGSFYRAYEWMLELNVKFDEACQ